MHILLVTFFLWWLNLVGDIPYESEIDFGKILSKWHLKNDNWFYKREIRETLFLWKLSERRDMLKFKTYETLKDSRFVW